MELRDRGPQARYRIIKLFQYGYYGLYIDEFPPGDDLGHRGFADEAALRVNRSAFVGRLREIGFYSDLSDAYITQNILPRYRLGAGEP